MFTLILILHLLGFLVISIFVIKSVIAILYSHYSHISFLAKSLAISSLIQLLSGSLLLFLQESPRSLIVFCTRISIYLTIIIVVETLLFWKMNQHKKRAFPLVTVGAVMTAGIIMTIGTLYIQFS
ncbi:MAG: hypothetical protein M3Q63_02535 [bacterium]|nr:hypothetical protein [bacterium]